MQQRTLFAVLAAFSLLGAATAVVYAGNPGNPLVVPSVESGSTDHIAVAEALAMDWDGASILIRVYATEGRQVDGRVDPPLLYDTSPDPAVGNGKAVVWTYAYASQDKPGLLYFVSIGGDGSTLYARELRDFSYGCCVVEYASASDATTTTDHGHGGPLGYAVDAPEAVATVADRPEFREFALDHPAFQTYLDLSKRWDGRAVWTIAFATATHFTAHAAVDARTGEVLHVESWPPVSPPQPPPPCDCPPPPCSCPPPPQWVPPDYHAEHEGSLSQARWWFEVHVPVESAELARKLAVTVVVERGLPTEKFTLRVFDPEWREVARDLGERELEATVGQFFVAGSYTILLEAQTSFLPRDNPVFVVADVEYAPDAAAPPTEVTTYGVSWGFGSEWGFSLPHQNAVERAVATLSWDRRVPTENLELVAVDAYGNEMQRIRGGDLEVGTSVVALELEPGGECCWGIKVRGASLTAMPIEFKVDLKLEYVQYASYEVHELHHEEHHG